MTYSLHINRGIPCCLLAEGNVLLLNLWEDHFSQIDQSREGRGLHFLRPDYVCLDNLSRMLHRKLLAEFPLHWTSERCPSCSVVWWEATQWPTPFDLGRYIRWITYPNPLLEGSWRLWLTLFTFSMGCLLLSHGDERKGKELSSWSSHSSYKTWRLIVLNSGIY